LGGFPDLSVDQARKEAAVANAQVAKGEDPRTARRAAKGATLRDVFTRYDEVHLQAHQKPRTRREWNRIYKVYLAPFHNRALATISQGDVAALHGKLGRDSGQCMANKTLNVLRAAMNFAIGEGWRGTNPCNGVKRYREMTRDRFMNGLELQAFFTALAGEPDPMIRDYFQVCLLVGARGHNTRSMRWDQLDPDAGVWRIPDTKSGQPATVILPKPALEILRRRHDAATSEWVFPCTGRATKTGTMPYPLRQWDALLTRAGLKDLRMHDLRRTLGSWEAATGASLPIIGKSLGHTSLSATQIYARLDLDPVRRAVEVATQAMLQAAGIEQPALPGPVEQQPPALPEGSKTGESDHDRI
jgi:integrase